MTIALHYEEVFSRVCIYKAGFRPVPFDDAQRWPQEDWADIGLASADRPAGQNGFQFF